MDASLARPRSEPSATPDAATAARDEEEAGIAEPETLVRCERSTCAPGGKCRELPGGHVCECRSGYAGTGTRACANERFELTADTALDRQTGLTWQRAPGSDAMAQELHAAYCAGLATAGGHWRAPTLPELMVLLDRDTPFGPRIDWEVFRLVNITEGSAAKYSSTTPVAPDEPTMGDFKGFDFWRADAFTASKQYILSRVRCVR
jgi:hypothetical protein